MRYVEDLSEVDLLRVESLVFRWLVMACCVGVNGFASGAGRQTARLH